MALWKAFASTNMQDIEGSCSSSGELSLKACIYFLLYRNIKSYYECRLSHV